MDRTCAHCGGPLPLGSRRNRVYCSTRCTNAAAWARDPEARLRAHKQWRDATAEKRLTDRLAAKPERFCDWCEKPLPKEASARRRFCDKTCGNRAAVRRDREKRVAANRQWAKDNPERYAARTLAYRETARENMRRYYERSPEVFQANRRKRRAREEGVGGPGVSPRDWNRLVNRYGGRCAYCGETAEATMDHVVPVSRGGWHAIGNVLPACSHCNTSKSNRLLIAWRLATR